MNNEAEERFLYAMDQVADGAPLKDYMDYDDIIEALAELESLIRKRRAPPDVIIKVRKEVSFRQDCDQCRGTGMVICTPGRGEPFPIPCEYCGGCGKMGLHPEQTHTNEEIS